MRMPNATHESRPWRIGAILPDFTLEDVWALPVHGGLDDFQALVGLMTSDDNDLIRSASLPTRVLWGARDYLGKWFGLGRISAPIDGGRDDGDKVPIPGTSETSVIQRLPEDLRNTVAGLGFRSVPFRALYRTDTEFAAEMSNRTVHGVMHLGWVDQGEGRYRGEMAVYTKPRGLMGSGYMAFIKPFRHWIVYPALMGAMEKTWKAKSQVR